MSASKAENGWPLYDIKESIKRAKELREVIDPVVSMMSLSRELDKKEGLALSNEQVAVMGDILKYSIGEIFDTIDGLEALNNMKSLSDDEEGTEGVA